MSSICTSFGDRIWKVWKKMQITWPMDTEKYIDKMWLVLMMLSPAAMKYKVSSDGFWETVYTLLRKILH